MDADQDSNASSFFDTDGPEAGTAKADGMFVDASAMKEKLRQDLLKAQYNVHDFYHTTGFFQQLGRNPIFENVTLAVITTNALWIWIDTDYNNAETIVTADWPFVIGENFFCVFFSLELLVRFMAFRYKRNCLRDPWFVFDSFLVAAMVVETWVMLVVFKLMDTGGEGGLSNVSMLRMFRLLRLSRMARMARLFRAMPELLILVKAMVAATRSVFFVCLLLVISMYIFAIALKQLSTNTEVGEELFHMVPKGMLTLLLHGALMDEFSGIIYRLQEESPISMVVFIIFILFAALTVMNMLIGVLCEVVTAVAATEKEGIQVNFVKETLEDVLRQIDDNGDGTISKTEFMRLVDFPAAVKALGKVGVDVVGFLEVADFLFEEDNKRMTFAAFMEVVLQLRGSNTATVKDIVDLRKFLRTEMQQSSQKMQDMVHDNVAPCARQSTSGSSEGSRSVPHAAISQDPVRPRELRASMALLEENLAVRAVDLKRLLARPFDKGGSQSSPPPGSLTATNDALELERGVTRLVQLLDAGLGEVRKAQQQLDAGLGNIMQ